MLTPGCGNGTRDVTFTDWSATIKPDNPKENSQKTSRMVRALLTKNRSQLKISDSSRLMFLSETGILDEASTRAANRIVNTAKIPNVAASASNCASNCSA